MNLVLTILAIIVADVIYNCFISMCAEKVVANLRASQEILVVCAGSWKN